MHLRAGLDKRSAHFHLADFTAIDPSHPREALCACPRGAAGSGILSRQNHSSPVPEAKSRRRSLTNWHAAEKIRELHCLQTWACGAAGSALPWHGRGRRFDPDQVHQSINNLKAPPLGDFVAFLSQIPKPFRAPNLRLPAVSMSGLSPVIFLAVWRVCPYLD